jgi:hypothetical protein
MHRDLKAEATQPPSANMSAQQRRFERWRHTYNHERPHEAISQQRPGEIYQPSARRLNENDKLLVYSSQFEVKKVSSSGHLCHEGKSYHVGDAFADKRLGLRKTPEGYTELYFANVHLGNLAYDSEGRFRPTAYIAPPNEKPLAKTTTETKPKV